MCREGGIFAVPPPDCIFVAEIRNQAEKPGFGNKCFT